jgi:hypothetical protein
VQIRAVLSRRKEEERETTGNEGGAGAELGANRSQVENTWQHGELVQREPGGHSGGYALRLSPSRPRWVGPSSTSILRTMAERERERRSAGSGRRARAPGLLLVYRPLLRAASTPTICACVKVTLLPQVIRAFVSSTQDLVRSPQVPPAQNRTQAHDPRTAVVRLFVPPPAICATALVLFHASHRHDVFSSTALFATTMLTRTLAARNTATPASNADTTGCYSMHIDLCLSTVTWILFRHLLCTSANTLCRVMMARVPLPLPSSRQRFRGAASTYETPRAPHSLQVCMSASTDARRALVRPARRFVLVLAHLRSRFLARAAVRWCKCCRACTVLIGAACATGAQPGPVPVARQRVCIENARAPSGPPVRCGARARSRRTLADRAMGR